MKAAMALLIALVLLSAQLAPARPKHIHGDQQTIELQYDEELSRLGFPNPFLKATVGGQTVRFIVDTGASVHTFASWLVKAAGLKTIETNSTVTGSTGIESKVSIVRNTALRLDKQREISIREAIVVDFPHIFEEHHIAGLISPQLLAAPGKSVVLDLHVPRLGFTAAFRPSNETKICTNRDSQFANRLYAVEVSFANAKALFLVDTGATSTLLSPSSTAAASLPSQEASGTGHVEGVGGNVKTIPKTKPVEMHLPEVTKRVVISLAQPSVSCEVDGLLGMDVLRSCVLKLGESGFGWSCR
jgi:predicted aspartyl protease